MKEPRVRTTGSVIEELNSLLAEEVEAALRYLHLTTALDPAAPGVAAMLREATRETVQHAEWVGEAVRRLGGAPRLDVSLRCDPRPVHPADAVRTVLTVEEAALDGYRELLARVREEDADPDLVTFLVRQVELESDHIGQFHQLLASLGQGGERTPADPGRERTTS